MDIDKIKDKIENYMLTGNMAYRKIADNMWVINDEFDNIDNIVVSLDDPLVIFRVNLMDIPKNNNESFFEKLLRLNASSLVHGAYAIEENKVIIVDTLEAENLDPNEFQASVDAIIMAITSDYKELAKYLNN